MKHICMEAKSSVRVSDTYVKKLFQDSFWDETLPKKGANALLASHVAQDCKDLLKTGKLTMIPESVVDLFRDGEQSYAKIKYPQCANAALRLRERIARPVEEVMEQGKRPQDH